MPVIKRYPNRKLYDTEAKGYITLEQIGELIRDGQDIQVVDHATGEDLTALTLTQVILEQERKRSGSLPQTVLTGLIQAGGRDSVPCGARLPRLWNWRITWTRRSSDAYNPSSAGGSWLPKRAAASGTSCWGRAITPLRSARPASKLWREH